MFEAIVSLEQQAPIVHQQPQPKRPIRNKPSRFIRQLFGESRRRILSIVSSSQSASSSEQQSDVRFEWCDIQVECRAYLSKNQQQQVHKDRTRILAYVATRMNVLAIDCDCIIGCPFRDSFDQRNNSTILISKGDQKDRYNNF